MEDQKQLKKLEQILKANDFKISKKQSLKEYKKDPKVVEFLQGIQEYHKVEEKFTVLERDKTTGKFMFGPSSTVKPSVNAVKLHPTIDAKTTPLGSFPTNDTFTKKINNDPVDFKDYGLFASFAPCVDSSFSLLSAQDSFSVYKRQLCLYESCDPVYSKELKVFDGTNQSGPSLSLSDEPIDTFKLEKEPLKVSDSDYFKLMVKENQLYLQELSRLQVVRIKSRTKVKQRERELGMFLLIIANYLQCNLMEMVRIAGPGIYSKDEIRSCYKNVHLYDQSYRGTL
jgi:hypothetical protein